MSFEEIESETMLLLLERKLIFNSDKKLSVYQFTNDIQNKFIQNLLCCNLNFKTFDDYLKHVYLTHKEYKAGYEDQCVGEKIGEYVGGNRDNLCDIDYEFYDRILNKYKMYCCTTKGCAKRYTSAYGLRYHLENGHSSYRIPKRFLCTFNDCNKSYKNANGLKYHLRNGH
ncbi:hypothetical protein CWI37_0746p0020 [Hamiltosporidium tvaerminnensis]|uniref:C2H2-type domain-containing protein n=1 Tax=Hamiltosporidium tvaerminnensis TaxID=1176355 RepID=A0A4Q9L1P7_9MICR|nr:hypothetical protein CWI37_0746p0020 [Hamiltosporidium tvaerminnensis]